MFIEDISQFFSKSDFAVEATWGELTANVHFEKPEGIIAGGDVITAEYAIIYKAGVFPGLSLDDEITIDGEGSFLVNETTRMQDGKIQRTTLRKE